MQHRVEERGATLLDTVVGTALMLVVFVGIAGAFRLAVQAVGNNSARASAIALANERLEYIRSLAYDSIGTEGGIPTGALEQTETVTLNAANYTRRTFVSYEDDPGDGLGAADENSIPTDYKAVKTTVSWESRQGTRTITMVARVSPLGVETAVPGGTLAIQVTNDVDLPVTNAAVRIVNETTSPQIDMTTYTDEDGLAMVYGAPPGADYEVTVTKTGYSTAQTYDATPTNTNPAPAHLAVALNQTTAANFEIDLTSTVFVETYLAVREESWDDSFSDSAFIDTSTGVVVSGGEVRLAGEQGSYEASGAVRSVAVSVPYVSLWKEVSWSDTQPSGTMVRYRIYDGSNELIPDSELPGNADGFLTSPIDLSGISTTTYGLLRIDAELSTADPNETPSIQAWEVVYDVGPEPLQNIDLAMRGGKTIGSGPGGPVYKYDEAHESGLLASVIIDNVEHDTYDIDIDDAEGYDVASSCGPQPTVVLPSSAVTARLYLLPHTTNSLLVDVRAAGGDVIPGAAVRLQNAVYDTTVTADVCGQAFFSGLAASGGTPYSLEVSAAGYQTHTNSDLEIAGTMRSSVILE